VKKGYEVLQQIAEAIDNGKRPSLELSNQFYTLVRPTTPMTCKALRWMCACSSGHCWDELALTTFSFGPRCFQIPHATVGMRPPPAINTPQLLKEKIAMVESRQYRQTTRLADTDGMDREVEKASLAAASKPRLTSALFACLFCILVQLPTSSLRPSCCASPARAQSRCSTPSVSHCGGGK
jgi:hypothetical protein